MTRREPVGGRPRLGAEPGTALFGLRDKPGTPTRASEAGHVARVRPRARIQAMKLLALAIPCLLLAGCVGGARSSLATAESAPASCAANSCFAPESCAGEAKTCPPGPECFAPETCADEARTCPR